MEREEWSARGSSEQGGTLPDHHSSSARIPRRKA